VQDSGDGEGEPRAPGASRPRLRAARGRLAVTRPASRSRMGAASCSMRASASSADAASAVRCSSDLPGPPRIVVRGFVKVL
jgi:hypothetical protein